MKTRQGEGQSTNKALQFTLHSRLSVCNVIVRTFGLELVQTLVRAVVPNVRSCCLCGPVSF